MADFYLKKGDTLPRIRATLKDSAGVAVNLASCAVKFRMRAAPTGVVKVFANASVIDAPNGLVEYTWQAADTDTAGDFFAEWQLTFSSAPTGVQTVPNNADILISIRDVLG